MTTSTRKHSVHIQAPASVVFKYIEDPAQTWGPDVEVRDVTITPQGIGTTWRWSAPLLKGLTVTGTMTRIDQVVDASMVEESSTGPVWTWTLDPVHHDQTNLTLEMDYSERIPMLDKVMMQTVGRHTDEDMQHWLTRIKMAIEA